MKKIEHNAELDLRNLSKVAASFYAGTEPLAVKFYFDENGRKKYNVSGVFTFTDLTFEELNQAFEELSAIYE